MNDREFPEVLPATNRIKPNVFKHYWKIVSFPACVGLLFLLLSGCAKADYTSVGDPSPVATQVPYVINNITYYPIPDASGFSERGVASWYGPDFHGRPTSNGETYNMHEMTAAHKTLPMNTMLLVKNLDNGKETIVRVNDRGPFVRGRIIDLSYAAAKKLKIVKPGTSPIKIVALAEKTMLAKSRAGKGTLPDLNHGEFYVQIGAFSEQQNAFRLQKRFTDSGHTAVIQKYFGPKEIYYRVHVYAGKELSAAKRAENSLLEHGYSGAFVVAR
jgi:rare lipoprotein A